MGISLGSSAITMFVGSTAVKEAYIGSAKIWEKPSSSGSGSGSGTGSGSGSSAYSMRNIDELMDLVNE